MQVMHIPHIKFEKSESQVRQISLHSKSQHKLDKQTQQKKKKKRVYKNETKGKERKGKDDGEETRNSIKNSSHERTHKVCSTFCNDEINAFDSCLPTGTGHWWVHTAYA